jgi:hypothetical protein
MCLSGLNIGMIGALRFSPPFLRKSSSRAGSDVTAKYLISALTLDLERIVAIPSTLLTHRMPRIPKVSFIETSNPRICS